MKRRIMRCIISMKWVTCHKACHINDKKWHFLTYVISIWHDISEKSWLFSYQWYMWHVISMIWVTCHINDMKWHIMIYMTWHVISKVTYCLNGNIGSWQTTKVVDLFWYSKKEHSPILWFSNLSWTHRPQGQPLPRRPCWHGQLLSPTFHLLILSYYLYLSKTGSPLISQRHWLLNYDYHQ